MAIDMIDFFIEHGTGPNCRLKDVLRTHIAELVEDVRRDRAPMYKILCKFAGEDRLTDVFCDCNCMEVAKKVANRWKQGCFTHDANAVEKAVVVDAGGEVVYEVDNKTEDVHDITAIQGKVRRT